jgi:hypothetical protein
MEGSHVVVAQTIKHKRKMRKNDLCNVVSVTKML